MHDITTDAGTPFPDDWLHRLLRSLVRAGRLLESADHSGLRLSLSEVFALGELAAAGDLSQQDLADRLGLEKSTVSRLAASLERRQWLTRERDPDNRRFYRLRLTRRGRAAAERVGGHFRTLHAALFETLTPDEQAGLQVGLAGLIRALDAGIHTAGRPVTGSPAADHRAAGGRRGGSDAPAAHRGGTTSTGHRSPGA